MGSFDTQQNQQTARQASSFIAKVLPRLSRPASPATKDYLDLRTFEKNGVFFGSHSYFTTDPERFNNVLIS